MVFFTRMSRMIRCMNVHVGFMAFGLATILLVSVHADDSALEPYQPLPAPDKSSWSDHRLRQFMTDLRRYVYEHHAVTDENRRIYGMIYEFYEDGKQIQAMGLDSMHDGAWFVEALLGAERVHPEGNHLEQAQKYQIPFYTNVANNSDQLFPNMVNKSRQDSTPITEPIKGWVPRGWDDGQGYDRHGKRYSTGEYHNHESSTNVTDGGTVVEAYNMPSNHLAQDLVTMFLKVWLTTRNPAARRAARNIHVYRKHHFREIHTLARPVQYMDMTEEPPETFSSFTPRKGSSARCYYRGLYRQQKQHIRTYSDTLSFAYRRATAHAVLYEEHPDEFMWRLAWNVDAAATVMQQLFDNQTWPAGMWGFHRVRHHSVAGTGTLNRYRSDGRTRLGTRGIQLSWLGAAALPALRNHPEVWEKPYRSGHAEEPLVRMVEHAPDTDTKRDEVYNQSQSLNTPNSRISLVSDPKHLHILVTSSKPKVTFNIRVSDDVEGEKRTGQFTVKQDGTVRAENDLGKTIVLESAFTPGSTWRAELLVPYTVVPGQNRWINGVNHGRYDVKINSGTWRTVYLLSRPEYIIRRLEKLALGTVENWHRIWKTYGKLPGCVHSSTHKPTPSWGQSELGGYAHMIMNIAMILADRSGTSEWELLKKQFPDEPGRAPTLPKSVLQRLGLSE